MVEKVAKATLMAALKAKRGQVPPESAKVPSLSRVALPSRMLDNLSGIYVNDDRGSYVRLRSKEGGLAGTTVSLAGSKEEDPLYMWSDGLFRTASDAPGSVEFREIKGRFILVNRMGSFEGVGGERFAPREVPAAWKSRIGTWTSRDLDPIDFDASLGNNPSVRLGLSDGMLTLGIEDSLLVLEPVSDTVAAVRGLGRHGASSVRIVNEKGEERLRLLMHTYGREAVAGEAKQIATPAGLPPDLPGLIPLAMSGEGKEYKTSIGGYPVLSLRGSWREMGRQYGTLLMKELREFYAAISADLVKRGLTKDHIDMARTTFASYTPEMKALVEGMAETSGLSMEEHILLDASFYLLPGFAIDAARSAPACSGIAVSSPRTAGGKLYFARNWDMTIEAMRPYQKYIALVAFNPTDGSLSFANIRPIGQSYLETGMNEKGVLVELNNGSASDPGGNPEARFSVASLFDFLRTSGTLDDMIRKLTTTKMDASHIIQAADPKRAVSVEIPTFGARVLEQRDGALYALNNFARPTYEPWKGRIVELPANAHDDRQVCLDAILASPEWAGGVNLETVKVMMDRTLEKGGPVVQNPLFGTVLQVIAVPEDLAVYFRGFGYSGWASVDLKALFD